MLRMIRRFSQNQSGATGIEYGLIAVLIGIAAIPGLGLLGDGVFNAFDSMSQSIDAGVEAAASKE